MGDGLPECTGSYGHDWRTLKADIAGYGSMLTHVQEMCRDCGIIRLNPNRKVYVPEYDGDYREVEK